MKHPAFLAGRRLLTVMGLILLGLTVTGFEFAFAPPPSGGHPTPIPQYGVVRVYATQTFTGNAKITIASDTAAPFFVEKILIILNRPVDFDIILDTVNIDGSGSIQVSGSTATSRVVVVPAGSMAGDVVASLQTVLGFLLTKDTLGNQAISASGLQGNGLDVRIRFVSGAYYFGTTISAIALVIAPTDATITLTMT